MVNNNNEKMETSSPFFVYIIKNPSGKHYIGRTNNLLEKIRYHNTDNHHFTSNTGPWELVISHRCNSRNEAINLESKLKRLKNSKLAIKYLVNLFQS